MHNKILSLFLAFMIVMPAAASNEGAGWSLSDDGVLTITGDISYAIDKYPWQPSRKSVKRVVVDEGVTSIGGGAFHGYTNLESVSLSSTVTTIGSLAFEGCTSLKTVALSDGLKEINTRAFFDCHKLSSVVLPQSVVSLGEMAFYKCSGLKEISVPANVETIGENAFAFCSSVEKIQVHKDNKVYDSRSDCNAIVETVTNVLVVGCKNSVVPSDVVAIGNDAFHGCKGLVQIALPSGIREIGRNAFDGCSSLVQVNLSEGLAMVSEGAFWGCSSLVDIVIPQSVVTLDEYVFRGCAKLQKVKCIAQKPAKIVYHADEEDVNTLLGGAFDNAEKMTLVVPKGSKAAYAKADGWKDFGTVVEE